MEIKKDSIKGNHISIIGFGDVHEGNINYDQEAFKKAIKDIKKISKGRKLIVMGMGDYIDAILHTDQKRFNPTEIMDIYKLKDLKDLPRKQMTTFYNNIKPIEDYIRVMAIGNHEESYIKHGSFDVYDYLCKDLMGKEEVKIGYNGIYELHITDDTGKTPKTIKFGLSHGVGSAVKSEQSAMNSIMDFFKYWETDVNWMGHLHYLVDTSPKFITSEKGKLVYKQKFFGMTGSFLNKYQVGSRCYAETMKGQHSVLGYMELRIDKEKDGWKIEQVKHVS